MTPLSVGILGGMGPAAGADFTRLFVEACTERMRALGVAVIDQNFPEHWLAQLPVPDRTRALAATGPERDAPLDSMQSGLRRLASLGVSSVAIACNTAHAWHDALQASCPEVELLHMARETAAYLAEQGVHEAGLLATVGTYRTELYGRAFADAGVRCIEPDDAGKALLMRGIYEGVKAGDMVLASQCFGDAAASLARVHPQIAFVMACTEIPLALPGSEQVKGHLLLNPGAVLAAALARRAYRLIEHARI
jgi:aspartate racemase